MIHLLVLVASTALTFSPLLGFKGFNVMTWEIKKLIQMPKTMGKISDVVINSKIRGVPTILCFVLLSLAHGRFGALGAAQFFRILICKVEYGDFKSSNIEIADKDG